MKPSIALVNASINAKQLNNGNGFNFYNWCLNAFKMYERPNQTFVMFYIRMCLAFNTEKSCYDKIPLN